MPAAASRAEPSGLEPRLLVGVDSQRGIAWFSSGIELRRRPLGPDPALPVRWWEPVTCGERADELARVGRLHLRPSFSPSMPFDDRASLGWELVESELMWEASPRAFAALTTVRADDRHVDLVLVPFIARALAQLAPDTLATVDEVQRMSGRRSSAVRAARPSVVRATGRAARAHVGVWLTHLLGEPEQPEARRSPPRRRARTRRLEPLGGPGAVRSVTRTRSEDSP